MTRSGRIQLAPEQVDALGELVARFLEREIKAAMQGARVAKLGSTLSELIQVWEVVIKDRPVTAGEALRLSWDLNTDAAKRLDLALRATCKDRGVPVTPKRLGHWLRAHERICVASRYFERCGQRDHTTLWRVERAQPD